MHRMNIGEIQVVRKIALGAGIFISLFFFAVTNSTHRSGGTLHELIEWLGIVLIAICIIGRTWSTLYIGGRKIDQLVTTGPYSITRNPLYFFSVIGAAGFGAQLGSATAALMFAVIVGLSFRVVILFEERVMTARFGTVFSDYTASVPRFFPSPALWRDEETLTIRPPRVLRTFVDASVFLLSVPMAEGFEWLQDIGVIPVLLKLP